MRRVINSTYITLDGVIEAPQDWPSLGSLSAEGGKVQWELLQGCDAVLMGRHTYEVFAPVWSAMSGDPMSDRMNAVQKYVVSSTLTEPAWHNSTVIAADLVDAVRGLKEQPGLDIVQYGFGPVAHALMADGLLDELRLWVHPFFLGVDNTDHLIHRAGSTGRFELADSRNLENGIVILTYKLS
jgi:dihydrofolate reductase